MDTESGGGDARALAGGRLLTALSASRPVIEFLQSPRRRGSVAAVFARACLVNFETDTLVGLVLPEVDNGPLNVVVQAAPGAFATLQPGMRAEGLGDSLRIGTLGVCLSSAATWEPSPDWQRLRAQGGRLEGYICRLRPLAKRMASPDSLVLLLADSERLDGPKAARHSLAAARRAALALRAASDTGDSAQIEAAAARLAGLGVGLTPAGDDFLVGAMIWAWLSHPNPEWFCQLLFKAAAPKTTFLSSAFLRAASRGECSAPWHDLLAAMEERNERRVVAAMRNVVSRGHTSGADALAGFLWMADRGDRPLAPGTFAAQQT